MGARVSSNQTRNRSNLLSIPLSPKGVASSLLSLTAHDWSSSACSSEQRLTCFSCFSSIPRSHFQEGQPSWEQVALLTCSSLLIAYSNYVPFCSLALSRWLIESVCWLLLCPWQGSSWTETEWSVYFFLDCGRWGRAWAPTSWWASLQTLSCFSMLGEESRSVWAWPPSAPPSTPPSFDLLHHEWCYLYSTYCPSQLSSISME